VRDTLSPKEENELVASITKLEYLLKRASPE
jgi:hypothetical protein